MIKIDGMAKLEGQPTEKVVCSKCGTECIYRGTKYSLRSPNDNWTIWECPKCIVWEA